MNQRGRSGLFLALCAALMLTTPVGGVDAKTKSKKEEKASQNEPTALKKAPKLKPKGLRWGFKPSKVADVYDRALERDYLPRYKEVEPGIQEERLKEEINNEKRAFRQSYVALDHAPSSLDGSSFGGEFGYDNDEGFMKIKRGGRWRYLFFWKQKLYKVVDIYKLAEDGKFGKSYEEAVAKVEKIIGSEGRKLAANEEEGRPLDEVDWADGTTHFRILNFEKKKVAFAWVDRSVENAVAKARAEAKAKESDDIDPAVKDVLRKKDDDKGKDAKDKDKGKDKDKKGKK